MSENLPWQGGAVNHKFNWYMIRIDMDDLSEKMDDKSTPYYYASSLYEQIDGAFCDNEWLFQQFMSFYGEMINQTKFKIIKSENMTFDEYDNYIHKVQGYRLNKEWYIFRWEIKWLSISLYLTDRMLDGLWETTSECDPMLELFAETLFGAWKFLAKYKEFFVNSSDMHYIYQLLHKLCTVYLPIYVFIVEGDYEGKWVDSLPQEARDIFTKFVTFPKPLEEIEWTDIEETGYLFYYYLVRCCGYPGILADDDTNEDKKGE